MFKVLLSDPVYRCFGNGVARISRNHLCLSFREFHDVPFPKQPKLEHRMTDILG